MSAAVKPLREEEREEWTARYQALMAHYGMQPTWNNTGLAHENGDVEQAEAVAVCPLLQEWWGSLIVKRARKVRRGMV